MPHTLADETICTNYRSRNGNNTVLVMRMRAHRRYRQRPQPTNLDGLNNLLWQLMYTYKIRLPFDST